MIDHKLPVSIYSDGELNDGNGFERMPLSTEHLFVDLIFISSKLQAIGYCTIALSQVINSYPGFYYRLSGRLL